MYSCWVKIFQKRDNICRWLGLTPLASAFLLIDESSTHDQATESFKKCPPSPCFFNSSCVDSFSPCLLRGYGKHQSCSSAFFVPFLHWGALCPLSSSSQHTPKRSSQPFQTQVFNLFFLPHSSLFPEDSLCQVTGSKESVLNFQYLASDFLVLETLGCCQPKV